jgi:putative hydrolase of the HAD superfamily
MIKAVIFDFGNVLYKFNNDLFIDSVSQLTGKSKSEIFHLFYETSDLGKKFETGLISSADFFKELSQLFNLNISYEKLRSIYSGDKFTPVLGMREILQSLKSKYKLALLSNTSEWDFEYGMALVPEIKLFDTITLSYEVKAMKPDSKIYYDALTKLNLSPKECVYADDILENVQAAQIIGIKAIHFTDADSFLSFLNSYESKD